MTKLPYYYFASFLLLTGCNLHRESPTLRVTKSMLHGGPVKSLVEFSDAFSNEEVSKLTADDLHQTFSVCRKLINDPRVDVQRYGALCFFNVQRARFDTDPFVGPYLADLEKLVADRSTLVTHLLIVIMT